jgi:MFS transporter, Spinster family, sphingosine-1-phosphate transporter
MLSVHPSNRSFALAFSTLCIHALGDVPSPIIVGALLDTLAPGCAHIASSVQKGGELVVPQECRDQMPRVRLTLFITCMWLSVAVVTFALAWLLAWRKHTEHHRHHRHSINSAEGRITESLITSHPE